MPKNKSVQKKQQKKDKKIETDVYNLTGEVVEKMTLPSQIFGIVRSPQLLATAVRVYLANQRLGTSFAKTRSQVVGSTRKIYRQKGTGRARHGDIKAPIFVGGGVAHGPEVRDYTLELPKKMRRLALFTSLTSSLEKGNLKIIKGLSGVEAKTKKMFEILEKIGFGKNKKENSKTLIILAEKYINISQAGRNLSNVNLVNARVLNVFDVLSHKNILVMKEAVKVLTDNYFTHPQETPSNSVIEKKQTIINENAQKAAKISPKITKKTKKEKPKIRRTSK